MHSLSEKSAFQKGSTLESLSARRSSCFHFQKDITQRFTLSTSRIYLNEQTAVVARAPILDGVEGAHPHLFVKAA